MSSVGVVRHRRSLVVGLAVVVLLVVLAVLDRDDADFGGELDPRNPDAAGAQALARVLDAHGVDVQVVRGEQALLDARVDAGTGVVVTDPGQLGPSTLQRLRDHARAAASTVLVGDAGLLGAQLDLDDGAVPAGARGAACDTELTRGLVVRTYGGRGLREPGCFGTAGADGAATLVRQGRLWLLTTPASLSNDHVLERDNAALGLRLLGQQRRLVWYVADAADTSPTEGVALSRLLPAWLGPSGLLLLLATAALVLWRGRRLGPLVTEPLPVVVRAVESTQSRGRLYRRTGDRSHAARVLVAATRRRLGETLGLPPRTPVEAVADAAAARAGRDPAAVRGLLSTTTVSSDARLVDLGRRLIDLENEVRSA